MQMLATEEKLLKTRFAWLIYVYFCNSLRSVYSVAMRRIIAQGDVPYEHRLRRH